MNVNLLHVGVAAEEIILRRATETILIKCRLESLICVSFIYVRVFTLFIYLCCHHKELTSSFGQASCKME